jgi:hypothetical protein
MPKPALLCLRLAALFMPAGMAMDLQMVNSEDYSILGAHAHLDLPDSVCSMLFRLLYINVPEAAHLRAAKPTVLVVEFRDRGNGPRRRDNGAGKTGGSAACRHRLVDGIRRHGIFHHHRVPHCSELYLCG